MAVVNRILISAVLSILAACGGGDPENTTSAETVASTPYFGDSGNTHVNEAEVAASSKPGTATVIVEGEFYADGAGLIHTRFSPIWNVGAGWTTGVDSPAMQTIEITSSGANETRFSVRASHTIEVPAGQSLSVGIFFVDQATAQVRGQLLNARTRVEVRY